MGAEDGDGENPCIDGVRNDVATLAGCPHGSALLDPVVGFLIAHGHALTADSSAVASYMATFTREAVLLLAGSSINRPAADLAKLLKKNKETPRKYSYRFILSDLAKPRRQVFGPRSQRLEDDWDDVKPYIDGGLVITEPRRAARPGPASTTPGAQEWRRRIHS